MYKKVTSLLVAFSMVFSMFAASAFAAQLPSSVDPLIERLNAVFDQLDDAEKAAVEAAQGRLAGLTVDEKKSITEPAWNKIAAKLSASGESYPAITEEAVNALFLAIFSIQYGNAKEALLDIYEHHIDVVEQLVQLSGKSGLDDVSFDHLAKLVGDLEAALKNQLKEMDYHDLLKGVNQSFNEIFAAAYAGLNNPITDAFNALGIDSATMIAMKDELAELVDPTHKAAFALAAGYIRTEATLAGGNSPYEPNLVIMGRQIPNDYLDWSIVEQVSGSEVSIENGAFVVESGTGTAKVSAAVKFLNLKVFEGNVTVTRTSQVPVPGTPGVPMPAPEEAPTVDEAVEELENIVSELDELDEADDVVAVVSEAIATAQQALAQAATVKPSVTVEGSTAKAQLDESAVLSQIERLKEEAAKLREKLAELRDAANEKLADLQLASGQEFFEGLDEIELELIFTIDLGEVTADQAEAAISQAIVAALKEAGISRVKVAVNGVSVSLPAAQFDADITATISKLASAVAKNDVSIAAAATAKTRVAADQYDVKIQVAGQDVNKFDEAVTVSIPVTNPSAYDKELLTIVSVDENGGYVYYTGKYNAQTNSVEASVFSLNSPYTVVETVVSFHDLAEVQAWAGREIEVVAAKGIIDGKGAGTYDPTGTVTRAEFAKMIVMAFNLHDADARSSFHDVKASDWFDSYVASAAKHGLIQGKGNGLFDPHAPITRAEMATIAARALQTVNGVKPVSDVEAALSRFTDADQIIDSLRAGTALATRHSIVVGLPSGEFNPQAESSRAVAAVVIYRLIQQG